MFLVSTTNTPYRETITWSICVVPRRVLIATLFRSTYSDGRKSFCAKTVLSSPNQPVNRGTQNISTAIPRMNARNCAKASNLPDFRQTIVVLRRFSSASTGKPTEHRRVQHAHQIVAALPPQMLARAFPQYRRLLTVVHLRR